MKVEKLIELNKANQSVTMQVKKNLHPTNNVLLTETRIDNPYDTITIRSLDNNGDRMKQSQIIIQENGQQIFNGNFQKLTNILKSAM